MLLSHPKTICHPPAPQSVSSMQSVPGAKKVGVCWFKEINESQTGQQKNVSWSKQREDSMIHTAASPYPAGNFNIPIKESKCMAVVLVMELSKNHLT